MIEAIALCEEISCKKMRTQYMEANRRSRFFCGEIDKYSWIDLGSSYLPSELVAAFLLAQLESRDVIQERRKRLWQTYKDELHEWAAENGASLPFVPNHCGQAYHMFYLLMPSLEIRQKFIAHLRERSVYAVFHYLPLHQSEMGRRFSASQMESWRS
jgi:dTDP-4-amino-4,6-dideoxygalactose transaminase